MGNLSFSKIITIFILIGILLFFAQVVAFGQCKKFIQVTHKDTCSFITLDENTWTDFYMAKKKLDTIAPLFISLDSLNKRLTIQTKIQEQAISNKDRLCEYKSTEYRNKIIKIETENSELVFKNSTLSKNVSSLRSQRLTISGAALVIITLILIVR